MQLRAKASIVAAVAGCACSAALAQTKPQATGLQFGGYLTPAYLEHNGIRYPIGGGSHGDDNQIVYNNGTTGTPAAFYGTSLPNWHVLDQVSYSPGPGAGAGQLINAMTLNIAIRAAVTMPTAPIDVAVQFWDTLTPTANPVTTNSFGTFRVTFNAPATGWAINTYYLSNPIDLSGMPGGGFQSADDQIYVDIAYLTQGGQIPAGAHPDATTAFADFTAGHIENPGFSGDTYWRDVNANGTFDGGPPSEERIFAAPAIANFIMSLQADVVGGITGACCLADGNCSVIAQTSCLSRTGVYRGDGTTCPSNCAAPFNEGATDAGDLPSTAAIASGSGPLPGIVGALGLDDADMYQIQVCDAPNFIATTTTWASLDTQLFMFRQDGTGVVHNDDDALGGTTSRLTNQFVGPAGNGTYYIAVSQFDKDPASAGGDIWNDEPFGTERAPDGPGASGAITSWNATATAGGNYVIAFRGACFIGGAQCYPDCNADHALNVLDFVCFQGAFAGGNMALADCNHDTVLNVLDFVCFQGAFAAGCSAP